MTQYMWYWWEYSDATGWERKSKIVNYLPKTDDEFINEVHSQPIGAYAILIDDKGCENLD